MELEMSNSFTLYEKVSAHDKKISKIL
jgi:hypothetical protein